MQNIRHKLKYIFLHTSAPIVLTILFMVTIGFFWLYSEQWDRLVNGDSKNLSSSRHAMPAASEPPREDTKTPVSTEKPAARVEAVRSKSKKTDRKKVVENRFFDEMKEFPEEEVSEEEEKDQYAMAEEFFYRSVEETRATEVELDESGGVSFAVETIDNATMRITAEKIALMYFETFPDASHVTLSLVDGYGEVVGGRQYPRGFMGYQPES